MAKANVEEREIMVPIPAEELPALGKFHRKVLNDIAAAKEAKKVLMQAETQKIKKLEEQEEETRRRLETEEKPVKIECKWRPNYATGNMELHRPDTDEVIDSRPLTFDEREMKLFDGDESLQAAALEPHEDPIAEASEREAADAMRGKGNGKGKTKKPAGPLKSVAAKVVSTTVTAPKRASAKPGKGKK